MKIPVTLRLLTGGLADRLRQATETGYGSPAIGCQGPCFPPEVEKGWAFAKRDTEKVTAAVELLATLMGVRLWVLKGGEVLCPHPFFPARDSYLKDRIVSRMRIPPT